MGRREPDYSKLNKIRRGFVLYSFRIFQNFATALLTAPLLKKIYERHVWIIFLNLVSSCVCACVRARHNRTFLLILPSKRVVCVFIFSYEFEFDCGWKAGTLWLYVSAEKMRVEAFPNLICFVSRTAMCRLYSLA